MTPEFFDDHLKVDVNAKGTMVDKNAIDEGGALGGATYMNPTKPIYDRNSIFGGYYQLTRPSLGENPDELNPNQLIGSWNPLAILNQRDRPEKVNRILANVELDYKFHFLPELRAVTNVGLEASRSKIEERFAENSIATYSLDSGADEPGTYIFNPGVNYKERQHITNTTWESFLAYKKDLEGFLNSFDVQAGYSYQNFKNDGNSDTFQT